MQPAFLPAAQFRNIGILLFGREQKEIEELGRTERTARSQRKMFGNILYEFDDPHIFLDHQPLLGVIAENDGLADIYFSAICLLEPLQDIDKGRFAYAIATDDADAFAAFEGIVESF